MEEKKLKAEKLKTEAKMTEIATDVNEAPKGDDLSGLRVCDHKEEK